MRTDPAPALAAGLAVSPLAPGAKRVGPGWQRDVTTDLAAVAAWPADANIGVACRASHVVGLDLDRKDDVDGVDALPFFRSLCRRGTVCGDTVMVTRGHQRANDGRPPGTGDMDEMAARAWAKQAEPDAGSGPRG